MSTYALLGATGATGSAILRYLLEEPPKSLRTLKVFVRTKSKLLKAFPTIDQTSPFAIEIFEALPNDSATLQRCLQGADLIFQCIATNQSTRGISVCYDTTSSIIAALRDLRDRQGSSYTRPTFLALRSANANEIILKEPGSAARAFVQFCLVYVYADLKRGCDLLVKTAEEDPALLAYVLVDPPGLMDAEGTTRTGHELLLDKPPQMGLMYADLGAAFCEIAERRGELRGKAVLVSATGHVNMTVLSLVGFLSTGLKARLLG